MRLRLNSNLGYDSKIFQKINTKYSNNIIFVQYSSIEALFKAYNENLIPLEILIKNAFYNTFPLYIKEGKLCTVFENREIKTERDVDEEAFRSHLSHLKTLNRSLFT